MMRTRAALIEVPLLREGSPEVPLAEHPELHRHQRAALRRMAHVEACCDRLSPVCSETGAWDEGRGGGPGGDVTYVSSKVGLLCDKPGSGKSHVVMALSRTLHRPADIPIRSRVNESMTCVARQPPQDTVDTTLLVCPHGIYHQWVALLERHYRGGFVCGNRTKQGPDVKSGLLREPAPGIVLVTPLLLPLALATVSVASRRIKRVVVDESDTIALPSGASHLVSMASFLWLVTASPQNILSYPFAASLEFRHSEGRRLVRTAGFRCRLPWIKNLVASDARHPVWVDPERGDCPNARTALACTLVKCDDRFIEDSFAVPPPSVTAVACRVTNAYRILGGITSAPVLDRIGAGDDRAAMELLGIEPQRQTNVVLGVSAHLERQLRNAVAAREFCHAREYATEAAKAAALERVGKQVEELEQKISSLRDRISSSSDCLICFEPIAQKTITQCCNNSFHFGCITRWLVQSRVMATCPLCRTPIGVDSLTVVEEEGGEEGGEGGGPRPPSPRLHPGISPQKDMLENLAAVLTHTDPPPGAEPGAPRKFLIFSDNDQVLASKVARVCLDADVAAVHIKGNANVVRKAIGDFRDSTRGAALLINCNGYGSGMDMSCATDLVILRSVPRLEEQVVGRANRPPRTTQLRIWKFEYAE
jgi:hypothetical protein